MLMITLYAEPMLFKILKLLCFSGTLTTHTTTSGLESWFCHLPVVILSKLPLLSLRLLSHKTKIIKLSSKAVVKKE